ncbi:MAG: HD domain-containing protein, partial [bacterium]
LQYAEEILSAEGGSAVVVHAASILHDIGIHEAERKHGSSAGRYQEIEGPPIARQIMENIGLDEPDIEHVCRIIANHHSARDIDTLEFRIIWDADWLVNFPEGFARTSRDNRESRIGKIFRTPAGRAKAQALFGDETAGKPGACVP